MAQLECAKYLLIVQARIVIDPLTRAASSPRVCGRWRSCSSPPTSFSPPISHCQPERLGGVPYGRPSADAQARGRCCVDRPLQDQQGAAPHQAAAAVFRSRARGTPPIESAAIRPSHSVAAREVSSVAWPLQAPPPRNVDVPVNAGWLPSSEDSASRGPIVRDSLNVCLSASTFRFR